MCLPVKNPHDEKNEAALGWLEALWIALCLAFVFQLYPPLWWGLIGALDVRAWSWRSYATASAFAIIALVIIKAMQEAAWNRR